MSRIDDLTDIEEGLRQLAAADERLALVIARAGDVPLRRRMGGYEGLAEIVVSQQLSKAAADTIWKRLLARLDPFAPETVLAAADEDLRVCGLSRPKVRTLRALAEAATADFRFEELADLPAEEAIAAMTALHGIGRWTAEVYLLFCCGHADIFPAGDIALQNAVRHAFEMEERPPEKALREIAEGWSPWRGVAARLFWRYYAVTTKRDAIPVGAP
ncbi:DNA-3-methyladenine glycosylase [Afifella sp. IM 167]|uniref:DNA-3-methyladenine glycosylase family protein n=1 Tax=Afifella sp. IM 167 TaxID=2033586 RepID=UPI001CCFFBEF|nr:DNA-3-methyladenine glycosylase [Afifella sp. IM 167]MBZ8135352.1 DNA-3-methyladenine glycosidase [Afifella sp. IM 167]